MALLVLGGVIAAWRWRAYAETGQEERDRLQIQARVVSDHLGLLLHAVNKALLGVRAESRTYLGPYDAQAASARLSVLNDVSAAIRSLQIVDRDGRVIASSSAGLVGTTLGERPCFQRARVGADASLLYFCAPFKAADGAWSVDVMSVRQTATGVFTGMVAATLDIGYLQALLPSALYASDMRSLLLHGDGVVIATAPEDTLPTGTDLGNRPGSLFSRYRALGRDDAVVNGAWAGSAGERMVSYRSVRPPTLRLDKPLLLTLSRHTETVYAPWLATTALFATLWLVEALASGVVLQWMQRRRRALASEAALRQKQRLEELERIELVVSGAQLSLWVWNVPHNRMEIDARWCAMLGCPADNLARAAGTWRSRIHPGDLDSMQHTMARQMSGEIGLAQFEYRMRHEGGHWIWVLTRGKVVERSDAGAPLRLAGTHQDITERKLAEEALRRSEESLATTLQSIGDAVISTEASGRIVRMNPAAERLTAWSAAEAAGRPLTEVFRVVDGRTGEPVIDPVQRVLDEGTGAALANGTALISRDGSERQIAESAAPIRDAAGTITGVVLVFSDVSGAYRVQQALRDSEEQLRLITDAMPGTVARYDMQRRFLFANPAHERWLGLTPCELIGRSLPEVFGQANFDAWESYTRRAEAGSTVTFETSIDSPNLGTMHVLVTLAPDFDESGQARGHFSIVTDITERRAAEAERRALDDRLRESQKMDSIGTLAGGIAHDFNNVLGAIIGNAELARQEVGEAHPAVGSLQQISRASQRARGLVQQILTFSRKQPQQLVNQPLRPLIEETLALLRATLPARVELNTSIVEVPLYVNADATQMQQVLMNLGTNAWHALQGSTGHLGVGLELVTFAEGHAAGGLAAGQYAHLSVSDSGAGMDEATLKRIFEPFFTTKPVGQGTGLGLSVVHGIVKTHLGAITVDSTPGQGTTFHVYLPATERPSQVGALDEAEVQVMRGRGQHVMYVDDDDVMVLMVERLLDRAGYRVTACRTAKQALAAFIDRPRAFDVVVTDFNMPGFSGLELAGEMAHIRPELPVVVSSGYLSEEVRSGAERAGIRYLMQKQNTYEELGAIVHRALADADAARQAAAT